MCLKGERSQYLCLCIYTVHTSQIETWNDSSLSLTDMRAYGGRRWNNWLIGPGNRLASLRGHKSWKFQNKFLRGSLFLASTSFIDLAVLRVTVVLLSLKILWRRCDFNALVLWNSYGLSIHDNHGATQCQRKHAELLNVTWMHTSNKPGQPDQQDTNPSLAPVSEQTSPSSWPSDEVVDPLLHFPPGLNPCNTTMKTATIR